MKIEQKTRRKIFTVIAWTYLPLLGAVCPLIWLHVILASGVIAFKSISDWFESAHVWLCKEIAPTFNRIFGVEYILTEARRLSEEENQQRRIERIMQHGEVMREQIRKQNSEQSIYFGRSPRA